MKIQIASTFELASGVSPDASVEAEYGDRVIAGNLFTLAHHAVSYRHMPAPCELENQHFRGDILISHIDLDTIGGCLALYGIKPEDDAFWRGAAFVDTRGPHRVHELPPAVQEKLRAYWAYADSLEKSNYPGLCDVTDEILKHGDVLARIVANDPELIQNGATWARDAESRVEACLVSENQWVRAFKTTGVFCNAAYYSPNLRKIIPAIVVWNEKWNSITLSFEDGGKRHDASVLAKKLWGDLAGGHAGIAGSPRGWKLTEAQLRAEFNRAINYIHVICTDGAHRLPGARIGRIPQPTENVAENSLKNFT